MEAAEDFYKQAAVQPGVDARSKQSIYSNAYYGYMALTARKNKNAAFIEMLENSFLK